MSKSRNSRIYHSPRGEDLEYENLLFGEVEDNLSPDSKIRDTKYRREQRLVKQQSLLQEESR